ncbi:uncharacterized protein PADG_11568 [Paracoccidioides brasiliensis Pb18]|uniref:Uncharacterized protein n=1 Tax=Paracoccidioides brasiliensis (strain Pb18) TaxID=502780 RepID=A0A0A0HT42_PARBD|nr:uncharacterized protein PADG_11568 [Paracoccidioides brasiliensis Pb18]KGM92369.1 hypothetical protein PADG_11568 [Paracoccidioides brasiliensis Pb18]
MTAEAAKKLIQVLSLSQEAISQHSLPPDQSISSCLRRSDVMAIFVPVFGAAAYLIPTPSRSGAEGAKSLRGTIHAFCYYCRE